MALRPLCCCICWTAPSTGEFILAAWPKLKDYCCTGCQRVYVGLRGHENTYRSKLGLSPFHRPPVPRRLSVIATCLLRRFRPLLCSFALLLAVCFW